MAVRQYFGTDGIRGEVGQSLINAEFSQKLGWAAGRVLGQDSESLVLIGRDTRVSGDMLQSALQSGLSAAGVDVRLLGVIPTPAVAHLTHSLRATAGIVISASHNAYQDNGVKFFGNDGMKLSNATEAAIEEMIDMPMVTMRSDELGTVKSIRDAGGRYIEFCKSTFPYHFTLRGLKVAVDCANGATASIAPKVFHELGAEVIAIADQPDGYNINRGCGATDVAALRELVVQKQMDVGIALDGDGDRLIMIDAQGKIVDGDEILCILAQNRDLQRDNQQGVVGTVMSNLGLEQALVQSGIAFERANVGDRYVLEALLKHGWSLGGESSGHIVDLSLTTTGDGIITALQVLRVMVRHKKALRELTSRMTKRPQVLINVPVGNMVQLESFPMIADAVQKMESELADRGRVLLRPSGTEPVVRVMVEGNDHEEVQLAAERLAALVARELM